MHEEMASRARWRRLAALLWVMVLATLCAALAASVLSFAALGGVSAFGGNPTGSGEDRPDSALSAGDDAPLASQPGELPDSPAQSLPLLPSGTVYLLLLGIDARPDQTDKPPRTDAMTVLRLDFDHRTASLLSFPRDLWLTMPAEVQAKGVTEARINQGYYYGELFDLPGGGPRTAMDTVSLNFGIPLQGYVLVDFQGFVEAVDALGGIEIDVPEAIYDPAFPTDDYGTIVLEVPPGPQHMDGIAALRYARTRHQDSDTKRIQRQQLVLIAIREAALQWDVVTRVPELWQAVDENFATSLTVEHVIAYGLVGQSIPRKSIKAVAIDQTMLVAWETPRGAHVWLPKNEKIQPLVAEFMLGWRPVTMSCNDCCPCRSGCCSPLFR